MDDDPVVLVDNCYDDLDQCLFLNAINNVPESKSLCLLVIKRLNRLLNICPAPVRAVSPYALELYDAIVAKKDVSFLSLNDKLLWLSSRVNASFFPPNHHPFFHNRPLAAKISDGLLTLPAQYPATFHEVTVDDWSVEALPSLYQDLLSNCSFVSSFLSLVQCGQAQPLLELVAPREPSTNYLVCLNFNGCRRLVRVDNTLPIIQNNRTRNLIISSSSNPKLLWPALIEKAFLKVMGNGYNFQGSNMAVDTYMLVGWLPEIEKLNNGKLPANFKKLWKFHKQGFISLGLGTGKLSAELSHKFNLVSSHDYLIHDFDEATNIITLKNPWIENNDEQKRLVSLNEFNLNFLTYFYMCWDPKKLFKFSHQVNFVFPKLDPITYQWFKKPQFSLQNNTSQTQEVWVFLERHLPTKLETESIKIEVFQTTSGEKVMVPNQYLLLGETEYTNSRLVLLKVKLEPSTSYTVVVTGPSLSSFSLSIFHNISDDFKLTRSKNLYPQSLPIIQDGWIGPRNGGNWSLTSFLDNPQYEVEIKNDPTNLQMILMSENHDKQVNLHLFYSDTKGVSVRNFDKSKLLFNENYTPEFHFHTIHDLRPGVYKLILSSYNKEIEGNFSLVTYHDSSPDNIKITPLSTSLGLFLNKTKFLWDNLNRKKVYFQTESFNSKITFHLKFSNDENSKGDSSSDYRPALRGSLFNADTQQPVQINEKWNDCPFGIYVDCILENPSTYILLIERFESGVGYCTVDVGCDKKFTLKDINR